MKIAIISDIHGNLEAFLNIVDKIETLGVDQVICLGDVVGYGASPNECCEICQKLCDKVIMGNHDAAVVNLLSTNHFNPIAQKAVEWTKNILTQENRDYLQNLSKIFIQQKAVYIHGSLMDPYNYIYGTPEAQDNIEILKQNYKNQSRSFFGHTHYKVLYEEEKDIFFPESEKEYILKADKIYLANPGSIGQPRGGMTTEASFCLYDDQEETLIFYEIPYNIEKAANKILKAGLPYALANRLFHGV